MQLRLRARNIQDVSEFEYLLNHILKSQLQFPHGFVHAKFLPQLTVMALFKLYLSHV